MPGQGLSLGYLSTGSSCVRFDVVLHELGHAIGFYHEHQRPDRDDYVSINDVSELALFFLFQKKNPNNTTTLGYGYDYASIMHYDSSANIPLYFSNTTIVAKGKGIVLGAAKELSPLDILKANRLYRCGKCH